MYQHKVGYAPNEPIATHARRRYRLARNRTDPNGQMPDQSLWMVHYTQCDPQDRVPSNVIPIDQRIQGIMSTRQHLHAHGQIVQKEFMLNDRNNWPSIAFPRGPPRGNPGYGGHAPPPRVPQAMAYPTQHAVAGPPAKRARTQQSVQGASGSAAVQEVNDDEDFTHGDFFDLTTPREVSIARYKQNHEWMEEILSSPYAIHQIIPTDLGLGVKGEMGGLTDGVFDAPYDPDKDVVKHSYVGRLDPEKAEMFRKRATEQIAETNDEIEKMKAKHAKRLAKFKKGSLVTRAEKQLRTAVDEPTDTGSEIWRLEGKITEDDNEEGKAPVTTPPKVSDIVAQVEASVGRHAAAVKELIRIQDGGYEEPAAIPSPPEHAQPTPRVPTPASYNGSHHASNNGSNGSQHSGVLVGDADMDISNSAAGLLDQYHTGPSSHATPGSSFQTPQPHLQTHSAVGTPGNYHAASPQPPPQTQNQQLGRDISMANTSTDQTSGGDWVVVPPGGVSPPSAAQGPAPTAPAATNNPSPHPPTAPTSALNTPLPDFHTSPNDFADLGDLEGVGDYSGGADLGGDGALDLGMDLDVDMDVGGEGMDEAEMDDSAFGDAFHGVDTGEEGMGEGL